MEKSQVRSIILNYVNQNPNKNHSDLATVILEENPTITVSHRTVRRYVALYREENLLNQDIDEDNQPDENLGWVHEEMFAGEPALYGEPQTAEELDLVPPLDIQEELSSKYKIVNGEFQLPHRGAYFIISVEKVDRAFCAYSRKGLNLSGPMVQSILKFTPEEFHAITYHVGLNKESAPYSPYTALRMDNSDLYTYLGDNVSYLMNLIHKADGTVSTQLVKEYKEAIVRQNNQELLFNARFDEIKRLLPQVEIKPAKVKGLHHDDRVVKHVIIPDMHIGIDQGNYNYKIVADKLLEVASYLKDFSRVHVSFMGDVIHSVSGLNHLDTWKNMAPDGHGANAIIRPYELLMNFLVSIPGLERVNFVGGNHDRQQSDKKAENTAEGAKLIAYMLRTSLVDVPVIFDPNYIKDNDDEFLCLTILHGDNPVDKESAQTIAWDYGDPSKFNYVLTAHLHSRKVDPKNDGMKYRKEQLPAFCPADNYSKTVSTGSLPGFKVIFAQTNGLPVSIDIPLFYD